MNVKTFLKRTALTSQFGSMTIIYSHQGEKCNIKNEYIGKSLKQ